MKERDEGERWKREMKERDEKVERWKSREEMKEREMKEREMKERERERKWVWVYRVKKNFWGKKKTTKKNTPVYNNKK